MSELQASLEKRYVILSESFWAHGFLLEFSYEKFLLDWFDCFQRTVFDFPEKKHHSYPVLSLFPKTFPFLYLSIKSDKRFETSRAGNRTNCMLSAGKRRTQVISLLLIGQFRAKRENQSMRNRILFVKDWQLSNSRQINNKQIRNLKSSSCASHVSAYMFHDRVVSLAESRDYAQSTERHDQQIVLVEKKK